MEIALNIPLFVKIETVPLPWFAVAISSQPFLSKSPIPIPMGVEGVAILIWLLKEIFPEVDIFLKMLMLQN